VSVATAVRPAERVWDPSREALRATFWLGVRETRTVLRMPAFLLPNLIIPIFFFYVMVGSLQEFAARSGITNWKGFQIPVSIMFAVMSGSAGLNMVNDIESGYFDKLLVTPASRFSLLIGAMAADFLRIMAQGLIVASLAMITGTTFVTGVTGMLVMIFMASVFGIAYSGVGFAIALKTGNAQATQSLWALFMPFMFLTTAFAPEEALSGWLATAATFNPMTYLLRGMRALTMTGWVVSDIAVAFGTAALLGAVTMTLALLALRGRVR